MKRTLIASAILAAAWSAGPAYAGSAGHAFGAIDYAFGSFSGGAASTHPANFSLRGGYYFTDNIGGEIHLLTGGTTDGGIKVDQVLAGFFRAEYPMSQAKWVKGYLLLGYANADVAGATPKSNSSFSYGAGVDFAVRENMDVNVDYIQYFNANNQSLNAVSAGLKFAF